jgi:hypothetical protein
VAAVPAAPIHAADPGDTGPASQRQLCGRAPGYFAHDLVTGDELRPNRRQISFGNVEVSPANPARKDPQQHVASLQLRAGDLLNLNKRLGRPAPRDKNGCLHVLLPTWDAGNQATVPSCLFILGWVPEYWTVKKPH